MSARLRRLGGETARFAAVNIVATAVALTLFNLLTHGIKGWYDGPMNDRPLSSYLLANSIGMVISFFGTRAYVFHNRTPLGPGGGFVNYAIVNLASFTIPIGCLWFTRNVLETSSVYADNLAGNVIGALLASMFRFWAFRTFVFHRRPTVDRQETHLSPAVEVWLGSVDPELVPGMSQLVEHQPEQWHGDPHHVVRIPGDAADERPTEPVEGEGARDA